MAATAWDSSLLTSSGGWILDAQNRVVILHGLNISGGTKMPFFRPPPSPSSPSPSLSATTVASNASPPSDNSLVSLLQKNSPPGSTVVPTTVPPSPSTDSATTLDVGQIPGVIYSYIDKNFYDHRNVSFVNRPFTLQDAEQHFARLAAWGSQCVRLLIPWEALEHSGPGLYDDEYIDYVIALLKVAAKYNLKCFLDPHVDCWSRFTGGSGMPGWTIELAGLDMTKFMPTGAAMVHNNYPDKDKPEYPHMIWATNSSKLAASTMYTLFFAGQVFAPQLQIPLTSVVVEYLQDLQRTNAEDETFWQGNSPLPPPIRMPATNMLITTKETKSTSGLKNLIPIPKIDSHFLETGTVNIQHYLQGHFMKAFTRLAKRIHEEAEELIQLGTVMGFDSLNEPSPGYLNHPDLNHLLDLADLQVGTCPTPFQGMKLAQGYTVTCDTWDTGEIGPIKTGTKKVNVEKVNLWKRPVWAEGAGQISGGVGSHPKSCEHVNHPHAHLATFSKGATPGTELPAQKLFPRSGWPKPVRFENECIWAMHGVWDAQNQILIQPNYFKEFPSPPASAVCNLEAVTARYPPGKEVEWKADFWLPFVNTFSLLLRQQDSRFIIFVEPPINEVPPIFRLDKALIGGAKARMNLAFHNAKRWKPIDMLIKLSSFGTEPTDDFAAKAQDDDDNGNEGMDLSAEDLENRIEALEIQREERQHSRERKQETFHKHHHHTDAQVTATDGKHSHCDQPTLDPLGDVTNNIVVAPHFYDGYTNIIRDFLPFTLDYLGYKRGIYKTVLNALHFGWTGVGSTWDQQVRGICHDIVTAMGPHAILMGETGIPMDLHSKAAYKNQGAYGFPKQAFAMSMLLDAMDASKVGYTLWNYCADNSNQWGDRWNGEDFSIWCEPSSTFGATTEIEKTLNTSEQAIVGCKEGVVWWCCLPNGRAWVKRGGVSKKDSKSSTLWLDLLPSVVQSERLLRNDLYQGLRAGDGFLRAYPLAIWGTPILYRFRIGVEVQGGKWKYSNQLKLRTEDEESGNTKMKRDNWRETVFEMILSLECRRSQRQPGRGSAPLIKKEEEEDYRRFSTDLFVPRFHFALGSRVGIDNYESIVDYNATQHSVKLTAQNSANTSVGASVDSHQNEAMESDESLERQRQRQALVQQSKARQQKVKDQQLAKEKGKWHRFDVLVTDGSFEVDNDLQLVKYWPLLYPKRTPTLTAAQEIVQATLHRRNININNNNNNNKGKDKEEVVASAVAPEGLSFKDLVDRVQQLQRIGWDTKSGISEQDHQWIQEHVIHGDGKQKQANVQGGQPDVCEHCQQPSWMHLHGIQVRLDMWRGLRPRVKAE